MKNEEQKMTRSDKAFYAVIIILVLGTAMTFIVLNQLLYPEPEPGITIEYNEENAGERAFIGVNNVFDKTPLSIKFTGLDAERKYWFIYFTMKDTVNLARFENVTERIVIFTVTTNTYYLIRDRDNGEAGIDFVITINVKTMDVRG